MRAPRVGDNWITATKYKYEFSKVVGVTVQSSDKATRIVTNSDKNQRVEV